MTLLFRTPAVDRLGRSVLAVLLVAATLVFAGVSRSPSALAAELCARPPLSGTSTVTGTVNTYYPALTATLSAGQAGTTVNVGVAAGAPIALAVDDLVLVVQMQGAEINSTNTGAYGDGVAGDPAQGTLATNLSAGQFEYARVSSVAGTTIGLAGSGVNGGLNNTYRNAVSTATVGAYRYQIIRVPQYSTAVLSAATPPTALAWNGTTGGILALDAASTVNLNGATINVTGQGFRPGLQRPRSGTSSGGYANTDYRTPTSAPINGQKAEGIAGTPRWLTGNADTVGDGYPNGDFGRGAPGNAGGGGTDGTPSNNGENSGGGGGGNGGAGGRGGNTWNSNLPRGGVGGAAVAAGPASIVLGGGGGAGSDNNAVLQSGGGAGGGIVFVRAGSLSGTGSIVANGNNGQISGQDGSGGGGAGGTVVVVTSVTGAASGLSGLTITARGGAGGDETHPAQHGPGGGGGGGQIITSVAPATANVSAGVNGVHVATSNAYGAQPGSPGVTSIATIASIPGANTGSQCIDLSVTKSVSPATVVPGQNVTYTVVATNNGPFPRTGTAPITVIDAVPAAITGVAWTCSASAGSSCTASGSGSLSTTANLALGGTATYTITGTLSSSFTGTLSNTATVTPPSGVPELSPLDNTATASSVAAPRADLSITKTDGATTATPGSNVTYTIVVANAGPSSVTSAPVTDALPAGTTAGSWTCVPGAGATCGSAGGTMPMSTTVSLSPAGSATYTVVVAVPSTATGSLVNTAQISVPAGVTDPTSANNSATDTDTLTPRADLSITKTDGLTTVDAGTSLTYTIVATNTGPSSVTGATVADPLPAQVSGATWTCAASAGSSCAPNGSGNINQTVNLASGGSATFSVVASVGPAASGTISNTATVTAPGGVTDPTPGNNAALDTTTISRRADLRITKTDGQTTAVPGQSVTYTIVASNPTGPSAISGATVADAFAATLAGVNWTCTASPGSSCPASGSGNINASVDLAVGGVATFTATGTIVSTAVGSLANTATIAAPVGTTDPTPGNNSATDTDTLTPRADLSITKTDGVVTEIPGTGVTYTIVASNLAGPSAVTGATVVDTFPASIASPTWSCVASGGATCPAASGAGNINATVDLPVGSSLTYTAIGTIGAGATGTLVNTATVTVPAGTTDPTPANNSATDTDTLNPTANLAITKTDGSTIAVPGSPITYTIVASNPTGPSNMVGAVIADTIPATINGAAWTCATTGGATCGAASGSGNINTTANLPVGATATYTVTGTVSAGAVGTLTNTATIAAGPGGTDPDGSNNSATDIDTLAPAADLSITKTDGQTSAVPGSSVTYTVVASNPTGPSNVTGATIVDNFPAALSGAAWTCAAAGGATCGAASGSGNINTTANIPVGATATYTITATVSPTATGSLVNSASVSAPGGVTDPNPANNSATDTDTLSPTADLSITKTDGQTTATPGQAITYTIVATNGGPSTITAATVADAVSADLEGATWTCVASAGSSCAPSGSGNINQPVTLAPSGTATFTLSATVAPSATGSLANTATVTLPSGATDPTPGNNSATDTNTLTPRADLAVTKTDNAASIVAGTSTTYTIVVTNNGPSAVTAATLDDPLPAALTSATWSCVASAGSACPASGSGSISTTLDLAPLGTATFTLTGTVAASASGNLVNTATVAVPSGVVDPVNANDAQTDTDTITRSHDLSITKTDFSATAVPGSSITYTVVVSNPTGPSDAVGASVVDMLPASLTGATWTCVSAGGSCPTSGSGSINTTVDLPVGATATFTLSATVSPTATGSISNTATVAPASGSVDPTPADNSATDIDTLTPQADLQITKTDGATTAVPGSAISYTIVVTNAGPSAVVGADVIDTLPASIIGATWICTPGGGGSCAASTGGGDIATTVDLPVGATATFVVSATVSPTATGNLVNTASVSAPSGTTDPTASNNTAVDTDTLTPQADLSITKDDGVTTATPGGSTVYTIVVRNNGPSAVVAAPLTDTLPAGVAAAAWTCSGAGGGACPASGSGDINVTIDLPVAATATFTLTTDIASGALGTLTNTASVSTPGGVTDPNPANNSATDSDTLTPVADLSITKTNGQSMAVAGDPIAYTIVVTNPGPSTITGAIVTDNPPAVLDGVTWTCVATAGSDCAASGSGSISDVVDLAPAGTATYTLQATLSAAATGTVANTATVALPVGTSDPTPGNNTATDTDTISPEADLSITKSDGVTAAIPGSTTTYTVVASNSGPSDVLGATVSDQIPTGVTGFSWTCAPTGGATCSASGTGAISESVDLPSGASATFTVVAAVSAGASGSLSNTATISAPGTVTDTNLANNTDTDTDTLGPEADIAVTKTDGVTSATPGLTTTYTIVVSNNGPSAAAGVTVDDPLPTGATDLTWTCTPSVGASCSTGGGSGAISATLDLAPSASATFSVTASIASAATGAFSNTVTVTPGVGISDPTPGNDSATDVDTLTPQADLAIVKTDSQATAIPGEPVTYTITARNDGPSDANDVPVTDTLPATLLSATWACVPSPGSNCDDPSGTGDISTTVDLPAGGSAVFTLDATIDSNTLGDLINTATIVAPSGVTDPTPDNDSSTDTDTLMPRADLSITKTDGATSSAPLSTTTYTIVVANAGPSSVADAPVTDSIPSDLTAVTWTCTDGPGGNCDDPSGTGDIATTVDLAPTGTVTFLVSGTIVGSATGTLSNTASVSAPAGVDDPTPGNDSATDDTTITPTADLSITKTDGQSTAVPGQPVTYTITVANDGPSGVIGIDVADTMPTALVGVTWTCTATAGSTCDASDTGDIADTVDLLAGGTATYIVVATIDPSASGSLSNTATLTPPVTVTDPDTDDHSATDIDTLVPEADLTITKSHGAGDAVPGGPITYTIVVGNDGPSAVLDASVNDTLPADLSSVTWSCASTAGAHCDVTSGSGDIATTVDLPVGATATFTVNATVSPTATGTLTNVATVSAPPGVVETNSTDNSATDDNPLTPTADLSITKSDGASSVIAGDTITYTIVATNPGPSRIVGARVTDTPPASLTGVSWTCVASAGSSCVASGSGPIDESVTLAVGGTATFTLEATVASSATTSVSNTATVALPAGAADPTPGNNTATDIDTIIRRADLSITKTDGTTTATPGGTATYTIVASNGGLSDVVGATVADALPVGATSMSWTCLAGGASNCSASGTGAISEQVDIVAGSSVTFTVVVSISSTATGNLTNTALITVPSGVTDPTPANNSASDTDVLQPIVDIAVTNSDGVVTAVPGTTTTYTIVVSNAGPSAAPGTVVDFPTPAGGTITGWTCVGGSGTCGSGSGSGTISSTADLPPGGSVTYTVTVAVAENATGTITTVATATAPLGLDDSDLTNNAASDIDTLTPVADLSITKTDGAASATPGTAITYTIVVSNSGPSAVVGAPVSDALPPTFGSVTWTCSATVGSVCTDPTGAGDIASSVNLRSGGSATYIVDAVISPSATGTLDNTAVVALPSGITDPDAADRTATDSDTLAPVVDLSITKTDGLTAVPPLSSTSYTIVVSNSGPSTATDAVVSDAIPASLVGATWTCTDASGGTCDVASGSGDIAATVDLDPGGSVTFTLVANVAGSATGTIANTATVAPAAGTSETDGTDNSATDTTAVSLVADLAVTKTDGLTNVSSGGNSTYTIVVTNSGPSDVAGASFADVIPTGLAGVTWTCTSVPGSACGTASGSGSVSDSIDLASGTTVTYSVSATVSAIDGTISNTASIAAPTGTTDPVPGNDSATDTTVVDPVGNLSITKTDGQSVVVAGTTTTYTIVVTNDGPSDVSDISVADAMPATLTGVVWTCAASVGASCATVNGTGDISTTVDLDAGAIVTFIVNATVAPGTTGVVANTATITPPADYTDTDPADNSATDTSNSSSQADLSITKTNATATSVPGAGVTYTIAVTNAGPSTAVGATVADSLSAALTSATWTCSATAGASCSNPSGSGSINELVTIAPAATVTFVVTATVASTATGQLTNTATVTAPGGTTDPVPANNSATDTDDLTPRADITITKTDGVVSAIPGAPTTYTIVATNSGPSAVAGAVVTDVLPASLIGANWTCTASAGSTCATAGSGNISELVNLAVGGTAVFTLDATITAGATGTVVNSASVAPPSGVIDPTPADNSATDTTSLTPQADLRITKTDGATTSIPGQSVSYTITATNAGPSNVSGATIGDTLPAALAGATWTCVAAAGASCGSASGTGNVNVLSDVPVGGTVTITIAASIDPGATGLLTNSATIAVPVGVAELSPADNAATDSNTLTPGADLSITKTDGVTGALPGDTITYTITASNAGPSAVVGAPIDDTVPPELVNVGWICTPGAGASCGAPSGTGSIASTADLPVGSNVTYTVTGEIVSSVTGTIANTATVSAPAGVNDPDSGNNAASDSTTVSPLADVSISKTDGVTTIAAGAVTTYTIVVTNPGPSALTDVAVDDSMPAALTSATWTCSATAGATCAASGTGSINELLDMPAGSTATFTVTATVSAGASGTISNTATVTLPSGAVDPTSSNNTATDTTTVEGVADLAITKTDGAASSIPGTAIVYTLVATNAGPSNAIGASLSDVLPSSLTGATWTCTTSGGATCAQPSGSGDVNTSADIPVGGTVTVTLSATVAPGAFGLISNTAVVAPALGTTDPASADNTATDVNGLTPTVDLGVTIDDGVADLTPGGQTTYTIVVTNAGPSSVTGASVSGVLPAGLTNATWTCNCGTGSGTGSINELVDIPVGGSVTFVVDVDVDPAARGTITNPIAVSAPVGVTDTDPANNSDSDTDTLTPRSDVSITKTDGVSTVSPGQVLTYSIVVSNAGPSTADGAAIADAVPAGLTNVSWTCAAATGSACVDSSGTGSISTTADVAVGGTVTYTVVATVADSANAAIVNTASVSAPSGTIDPDTTNDVAVDTDAFIAVFDLVISKVADVDVVDPGDAVVYTIVVGNNGPSTAAGVVVEDRLPAGLTARSWTCSGSGAASCSAESGTSAPVLSVDIPAGDRITIVFRTVVTSTPITSTDIVNVVVATAASGSTAVSVEAAAAISVQPGTTPTTPVNPTTPVTTTPGQPVAVTGGDPGAILSLAVAVLAIGFSLIAGTRRRRHAG